MTERDYTPKELNSGGISVNSDGMKRNLYQVLAFPNVGFGDLLIFDPELSGFSSSISDQIQRDALYANYVVRQEKDANNLKRDEDQTFQKILIMWA